MHNLSTAKTLVLLFYAFQVHFIEQILPNKYAFSFLMVDPIEKFQVKMIVIQGFLYSLANRRVTRASRTHVLGLLFC